MLLLKDLLFTLVEPGTVGVPVPLARVRNRMIDSGAQVAVALELLGVGAAIYAQYCRQVRRCLPGPPRSLDGAM